MKNTITTVKQISENEARAVALYMYRIALEITDFEAHEEFQILYNALVKRLGLEKHAAKVMDAFIEKLIKKGRLNQKVSSGNRNPFDMKGKLKQYFHEDHEIYNECGNFKTKNELNVNLCRCVFSGEQGNFVKIIASTFFYKDKPDGNFKIPVQFKPDAQTLKAEKEITSVKFLKDALKLSDDEASFLSCAYRLNAIAEIYSVVNDLFCDDTMDRLMSYAVALGKEKKEIRKLLRSEEKLHSFGLLDTDGEFTFDAMACIESQDLNVYFADIISKEENNESFSLESFSVKKEKSELISRLLKTNSSSNVLLYGAPGAGKTEYAKAMAKASGLRPLVYKNELEVSENKNKGEQALYRLNALLSVKQKNALIIVDEAESVLKTSGSFFGMKYSLPQKGTVNKMLENSENKVVWILNYTDELDESTLRRFTYSLHFDEMPKQMLRSIAESKLNKANVSGALKTELLDLCGKYHVTGSSVDNMVKTVKGMDHTKGNENRVIQDVADVLEANSTLIFGKAKMRELVNDSYDLSVLNTSTPANELIEMVQNAMEYAEEHRGVSSGIRMLFYGLSGTGKTELVRYMAGVLNKKIVLKRASDLLGKYVGETEKQIRQAFEEAESSDSILLFDEADSFFADRNGASRSWERTMVNEFLTQMEEFSGILVCTTNLKSIMDPAMARRFHIMTEFKPLKEEGIKTLLGKFFSGYEFEERQIKRLVSTGSVTPGDFGALSGRIRFISKAKINSEYILNELQMIQEEKVTERCIGFAS